VRPFFVVYGSHSYERRGLGVQLLDEWISLGRVLAWIERVPYAVAMTKTNTETARSNTFRYGWDGPIFAAAGIAEGDALVSIFHQEGRYRTNTRPIRPSQALREAIRDGVGGLRSP